MAREFLKKGVGWILLVLIFFLPSQLGKHFWPSFSFVNGIRVDYLSPTFYFTDFLVLSLCLVFVIANGLKISLHKLLRVLGLLLLVGVVVSFGVVSLGAYLYGVLKLFEFIALFWVVRRIKINKTLFFGSLALMLTWPTLMAIVQFLLERSVGGGAYYLGERIFSLTTPGLAVTEIKGEVFLRPYATFSHPNSMAGFLLLGGLLFVNTYLELKKSELKRLVKVVMVIGSTFAIVGIILSWSRTALLALLVLMLLWTVKVRPTQKIFWVFLVFALIFPFALMFAGTSSFPFFAQEEIKTRNQLFSTAVTLFREKMVIGVGLKNFIHHLGRFQLALSRSWLQPPHNIFYLVLVETGLVGLIAWVWFLWKTCQKIVQSNREMLALALLAIIFTGANDHYWISLQQNQLLLSIFLAISWRKKVGIANFKQKS